jgi:fructose-1,6-bisphosphatase
VAAAIEDQQFFACNQQKFLVVVLFMVVSQTCTINIFIMNGDNGPFAVAREQLKPQRHKKIYSLTAVAGWALPTIVE